MTHLDLPQVDLMNFVDEGLFRKSTTHFGTDWRLLINTVQYLNINAIVWYPTDNWLGQILSIARFMFPGFFLLNKGATKKVVVSFYKFYSS